MASRRERSACGDLTTSLVQAEVNGERLTPGEIASFFILLVIAGSETTRNAISHRVLALTRYPEQRQRWWNDFTGLNHTAVEEILRWSSPVIYMWRTLTQDVELDGVNMTAGQKVTMWYQSANRDEATFDDPWTFDLGRDPNPHCAFGAGAFISVSAPTWHCKSSARCLANCAVKCPKSSPQTIPNGCCPSSSTESSAYPSAGETATTGAGGGPKGLNACSGLGGLPTIAETQASSDRPLSESEGVMSIGERRNAHHQRDCQC